MRGAFLVGFITAFLLVIFCAAHAEEPSDTFLLSDALHASMNADDPSVGAARSDTYLTAGQKHAAFALRRPTLTLDGNAYKTWLDNNNFSGARGAFTKQATLTAEQPIYQGGRLQANVDKAHYNDRASALRLTATQKAYRLQVINAYLAAARDQEIASLSATNRDVLQRDSIALEKRYALGDTQITDVNEAKSRYSRAIAQYLAAQNNAEASRIALESLLNRQITQPLKLPQQDGTSEKQLPLDEQQAIERARQQSEELQAQRSTVRAAREDVKIAGAARYPQVSAYASYDREYDPQPGLIPQASASTVGVRARWAIFDGDLAQSNKQQAAAQARKQEYQLQAIERNLVRNVQQNWQQWQSAKQETVARARQLVAATTAEEGIKVAVQMGDRPLQDQLDSTQETLDAYSAFVTSQANYQAALYRLASDLNLQIE